MSTDNKTKAELTKEFQKHMDDEGDAGGKNALRMIYEVLIDIRDGLIK